MEKFRCLISKKKCYGLCFIGLAVVQTGPCEGPDLAVSYNLKVLGILCLGFLYPFIFDLCLANGSLVTIHLTWV